MSRLTIDRDLCDGCGRCVDVCPFAGIVVEEGRAAFTENCRACPICERECPTGAVRVIEDGERDPAGHRGITVVAEVSNGRIQPVASEILGEARRLASGAGTEVHCVVCGHRCTDAARELLRFGPDTVWVYDHPELEHFRPESYTDALEDAVSALKPAVLLMAGTPVGRSLAPRLAVRLRTGLTADCTFLEMTSGGRLLQTRPAFGGDIMATIVTPTGRPQMATVRPGVMPPADAVEDPRGRLESRRFSPGQYRSRVLGVQPAPPGETIADADVIVAAGRGIRRREDLVLLEELAEALGGMVGCSRPLVEKGWLPSTRQVGLSGRTVRPRLYIACGIHGAIQHIAGMRSSELIVAINIDEDAPIFDVAHHALIGDLYEVIPAALDAIKKKGDSHVLSTCNRG